MAKIKSLFKKLLTFDGVIKLMVVLFLLNITHFGRQLMAKINHLFTTGMKGF